MKIAIALVGGAVLGVVLATCGLGLLAARTIGKVMKSLEA